MKRAYAYAVLTGLIVVAGFPASAPAWGPEGHAVVCQIAERFLTPRAREKIRTILQEQSLSDYEVASWPDIIRGNQAYAVLVYELLNGLEPPALAGQLAEAITPEQQRQWMTGDPFEWALESHELARTRAYRFSNGDHVPFTWSRPGMDLTRENYIDANVPFVREQLQKAGVRLARLLNTALDRPRRQ